MPLETAALRSKQALAFEKLPRNGGGSDVRIQVFRVAGPGDAVRVYPHAGALDGAKVYVGDGGLVADAMEIGAGPGDRLPGVVAQRVFE